MRKELFKKCCEAVRDAIWNKLCDEGADARDAECWVSTEQGEITIEVDCRGNNVIEVYHDNNSERPCPRLVAAINDELPVWEDVEKEFKEDCEEDEWTLHGFRDAADYYNWRYC